jgi:hypothetical protein
VEGGSTVNIDAFAVRSFVRSCSFVRSFVRPTSTDCKPPFPFVRSFVPLSLTCRPSPSFVRSFRFR